MGFGVYCPGVLTYWSGEGGALEKKLDKRLMPNQILQKPWSMRLASGVQRDGVDSRWPSASIESLRGVAVSSKISIERQLCVRRGGGEGASNQFHSSWPQTFTSSLTALLAAQGRTMFYPDTDTKKRTIKSTHRFFTRLLLSIPLG